MYLPAIPLPRTSVPTAPNTISTHNLEQSNNIRPCLLRILRPPTRIRVSAGIRVAASIRVPACIVIVPTSRSTNRELLAIVLRPPLRNRHQHRLMVTTARHTTNPIIARGQTPGDGRTKQSLPIPLIVDALEERELHWIRRRVGLQAVAEVLDGDVCMTYYLPVASEVLGCTVVGGSCVCEGACG